MSLICVTLTRILTNTRLQDLFIFIVSYALGHQRREWVIEGVLLSMLQAARLFLLMRYAACRAERLPHVHDQA